MHFKGRALFVHPNISRFRVEAGLSTWLDRLGAKTGTECAQEHIKLIESEQDYEPKLYSPFYKTQKA